MNLPAPQFVDTSVLLQALTTAVVLVDDRLRIRLANEATEQLFGVRAKRDLGEPFETVFAAPSSLLNRVRDTLRDEQPCIDRQVVFARSVSDIVTVDCILTPCEIDEGSLGVLLEFLAVDQPLRIARQQAKNEQQEYARLLLRGLAHEIKNPLGGLRGAAQLLGKQLADSDLTDYTTVIIREADRLQALIDRLLAPVSRPRREAVNVHEVLEHVRLVALAGAPPGVTFDRDYDPSIPDMQSDRDRLVQVLLNIVGNALEAIGESGHIRLRTRVHTNHLIGTKSHRLVVAIEIEDNGPGIPPELVDRVFYPMVTGTDHGTGLGLSISQSMMNQLDGSIDCESLPGRTVFTVLTPLELP